MAHKPQLTTRRARLSEDFGRDYATRLFGEEAVASIPLLKAGPHKGKPKGFIHWRKALSSGYLPGVGPVKEGLVVDAWIGEHFGTLRDSAMRGTWLGRTQCLAGSYSVLGPKYREEEARRQKVAEEYSREVARETMEEFRLRQANKEKQA